jgi:hypothetical protein
MQKIKLTLFLLAIGIAQPAFAYCQGWEIDGLGYYSVPNEFARARYVAIVRVDRVTWLGEDGKPKTELQPIPKGSSRPWGFDTYLGTFFDVTPLRVLKGKPPAHFRLFSENSTARFWLEPGGEYVVFVADGKFDPPVQSALTVDTCGNSPKPRGGAKQLLVSIARLRR